MRTDQLRKAVEGTATEKDLSAGMPNGLCSKAKYLSSAAAKGHQQLSKAMVVASEEVVQSWDEREGKDSEKASREKKK